MHVFYETGHLGLNHKITICRNIIEMLVPWPRNKIAYLLPPFPMAAIVFDTVQYKDIQGSSVPRQSFHLQTPWNWTLQSKGLVKHLGIRMEYGGQVSCRYWWTKNNKFDSKMLCWRMKRQLLENHCSRHINVRRKRRKEDLGCYSFHGLKNCP